MHHILMVTGSYKQQTNHTGIFNWTATILGFGGYFTIQEEACKQYKNWPIQLNTFPWVSFIIKGKIYLNTHAWTLMQSARITSTS